MDRHGFAVWAVLVGLLVGLVGDVFFFGKLVGLSVPLFALVMAGAVLLSLGLMGQPLRWRNAWPLLPLGFFALMVAVLDSLSLVLTNILAVLLLGALAIHYLTAERDLDRESAWRSMAAGRWKPSWRPCFCPSRRWETPGAGSASGAAHRGPPGARWRADW